MPKNVEMSASELAGMLGCVLNPCSTADADMGAIPPDPESCQHWTELVFVAKASDQAIDRALSQQRLGDALAGGEPDQLAELIRSDLRQVIDDFCGTPPRWPIPWPPTSPFKRDSLSAVQLIAAGCRFQAAADQLQGQAQLQEAADQLLEVGLARLSESGPM